MEILICSWWNSRIQKPMNTESHLFICWKLHIQAASHNPKPCCSKKSAVFGWESCICVHQRYWSVVFSSLYPCCLALVRGCCLVKLIWTCLSSFSVLDELGITGVKFFFKCLVEFTSEAIWLACVGRFLITLISPCSLLAVQIFFVIQPW